MRLLNRQGELLSLKQIGMAPRILERFTEQGLELPSGVLLITGPTGSGKTSTVYSCINKINSPQISIIIAEEPVEALINATAQRIQQEIMKEDPDVQLIEQLIVRDQAITGQVLRVANSSFYRALC